MQRIKVVTAKQWSITVIGDDFYLGYSFTEKIIEISVDFVNMIGGIKG